MFSSKSLLRFDHGRLLIFGTETGFANRLHGHLFLIQLEANPERVRVKKVRSGLPCLTYFSYLPSAHTVPPFHLLFLPGRTVTISAHLAVLPPPLSLGPPYVRFNNFKHGFIPIPQCIFLHYRLSKKTVFHTTVCIYNLKNPPFIS